MELETELMLECSVKDTDMLLNNKTIIDISNEFYHRKSDDIDYGFNIFEMFSDFYYRENFHSDIMKKFLEINGKHNEGDLFLSSFINLLKKKSVNDNKTQINISFNDFKNCEVLREQGRIDILIRNRHTNKAILIESKMNNASDTHRQLPTYVENLKKEKYEIVAIVYLRLNGHKTPTHKNWSTIEKIEIEEKMVYLTAYDETDYDLFNGWLSFCETKVKNIDTLCILKQYKKLIINLGKRNMEKEIIAEFYSTMNKEKHKIAMCISELIADLPKYLAIRIMDNYENEKYPFDTVYNWNDTIPTFRKYIRDSNFAFTILCRNENYLINIVDHEQLEDALDFVKSIGMERDFDMTCAEPQKIFEIFEEKNLFEFIDRYKQHLLNYLGNTI